MVDQQLEQGPIYGENDTTQATDQKGKILHRETDTDIEIQSDLLVCTGVGSASD